MLHGYRQLYSLHKHRLFLQKYCGDVETRLDTSNYELDKPFPNGEKSNWFNER